ncbi:hypothetical protein THAOC_22297 [Thalassiosira oceanica]|uniref:Uncharacterized protein n=1 Tax=Thalassiosira oceanica TaxID=159749 RepID=K0SGD9_THAOC|nr:hypothetical protein THAOC_22297 [Thalassiosira oceanica]|eukprot:EJK57637.1 hypothetical protein THAOC_22297 [Thalassiosira oceanica]
MRYGFTPVHAESLSSEERRRAIESFMTVKRECEWTIKARHCADGRMEEKEETTSTIGRVNAAVDLPGAYLIATGEGEKTDCEQEGYVGSVILYYISREVS